MLRVTSGSGLLSFVSVVIITIANIYGIFLSSFRPDQSTCKEFQSRPCVPLKRHLKFCQFKDNHIVVVNCSFNCFIINNSKPINWNVWYNTIYPMLGADSRFWLANSREV